MSKNVLTTLLLTATLLGAGCLGATDELNAAPPEATSNDAAGSAPVTPPDGDDVVENLGPRTIAHALGETPIEGTPERVVAIEWPYVEMLLALGVQPVGVADVAGYNALIETDVPLAESVVDVGTRQEPNLEKIAELEPDLIVGVKFRHEKAYEQLSAIAPTLVFDTFPEDGKQLENMERTVLALAEALDRPAAGQAALDRLHQTLEAGKARLQAAGVAGEKFALSQVLAPKWGDFRLFQEHHLAVDLLSQLGLVNTWTGERDPKGFSTVDLEALTHVEDAHFFYVPSVGANLERYAGNRVWENLDFVQQGRLYDLSGAWLLPGPLSGAGFVERVVDALAPESAAPRTVEHTLGATTIEGTPARIVALEWTYAEDLLALGIQPVGVADVAGYRKWVNVPVPLAESVVDVGTRQEPNLEKIAELEPDLIIGVKFRHEKIHETLSAIAPTLVFDPYPTQESGLDQLTEMEQTFSAIAKAVNREHAGERVLAEVAAHYAQAATQLQDAGKGEREILLAQAFTWKESPTMRVFTDNAMATQIVERIGLRNAWDDGHQTYGFSTVGLEALQPVQHADFFYVAQADDNPFENQWKENPVWNDLQFVEEGRVYALGGDTWLFGGPLSAKLVVDKVVQTLIG